VSLLSRPVLRIILVLLLLAVVAAEEYSVIVLRNKIAGQDKELKKISIELQTLKNERTALGEELASMKKITGDKKDGTTPARNN
jgi:ACT domain-containing protein